MSTHLINLKHIVAAGLLTVTFSLPGTAQQADLRPLYERLQQSEATDSKYITREIRMKWSQSGSDSMDLLLQRGKDALERGENDAAIEHFSAVIDHAPDFAEPYHGRAQAYFGADLTGPALADLERALTLNPQHFDALYGLGTVFEQLDDLARAYQTYALVLTLHPHYDEAKAARARLKDRVEGREL